jgi:DNA-binding LytR/AlgR family response regulator
MLISKSLINNYFSIPNLIIILSLLIITVLGTINYKLLRKKKDKQFTESKSESQNYIFVRANRLDIKVLKSEILYVEAVKDYVKLVTTNKNYLIRKNLKSFNKDVLDESFIRVSRSIIVNINKITFVDRNIVYLSDLMFKIGSNYTEGLNKLIKK